MAKYVALAAGNTIYVFADANAAAMQYTVLIGANLDVDTYELTPERWAEAKAALADEDVEILEFISSPE